KNGVCYLYAPGSSMNLTASVSPSKAYQKVEWSSNNASAVSVEGGVVTAISNGAAKITVRTVDGKNKSASFYVVVGKPAEAVLISGARSVTAGKSTTLSAEVLPEDAVNKKVVWSVAPGYEAFASVSSKGVVKGKKAGYAKIIAAAEGQEASGEYFVYVAPKSSKVFVYRGDRDITGKTETVYRNFGDGTLQLSARLNPSTADQGVSWTSSNTKIATVNANGVVTAKKNGTVTITATAKDGSKKKASAKLKFTTAQLGLQIVSANGAYSVESGKSIQLSAIITPEGHEGYGITWTSSDENLATVDAAGLVTARRGVSGEVVITASCAGISSSCRISITPSQEDHGFIIQDGHLIAYTGNDASVTIPVGITHIDEGAFEGNTSVVSIRIPNTVTVIGKRAFAGCTNLSQMVGY
ncbi:MAG: Ig-like domain-containing protein, partial [Clostridia bacterium]|nr:Ig-like domain-containing protein [Clostridia bacterium]